MKTLVATVKSGGSQSQGQIIHDVLMGRLQRGEIGPGDRLDEMQV